MCHRPVCVTGQSPVRYAAEVALFHGIYLAPQKASKKLQVYLDLTYNWAAKTTAPNHVADFRGYTLGAGKDLRVKGENRTFKLSQLSSSLLLLLLLSFTTEQEEEEEARLPTTKHPPLTYGTISSEHSGTGKALKRRPTDPRGSQRPRQVYYFGSLHQVAWSITNPIQPMVGTSCLTPAALLSTGCSSECCYLSTWYKALALGSGATDPCSSDVHMEPFPTSVNKVVSLD